MHSVPSLDISRDSIVHIYHLNCGTDCPFGGALFDGQSAGLTGHLVCHCLLIETAAHGLVLVDTGYGLADVHHPHAGRHPRVTRAMRALLNIRFRESETAIRQVEALGFSADDVRHIVLTHLDFDHAGGLEDFPNAKVHLLDAEYNAATGPRRGFVFRNRYRPAQRDAVRNWRRYGVQGEQWFGFTAVRDLEGLPPEILMVPLPGHTWGHAGVAVQMATGGCSMPETRISTAERCVKPSGAARRDFAATNIDGGGSPCAADQSGTAASIVNRTGGRRERHLCP